MLMPIRRAGPRYTPLGCAFRRVRGNLARVISRNSRRRFVLPSRETGAMRCFRPRRQSDNHAKTDAFLRFGLALSPQRQAWLRAVLRFGDSRGHRSVLFREPRCPNPPRYGIAPFGEQSGYIRQRHGTPYTALERIERIDDPTFDVVDWGGHNLASPIFGAAGAGTPAMGHSSRSE